MGFFFLIKEEDQNENRINQQRSEGPGNAVA